ncbi:hypothetical protein GCM10007160_00280 [Litchfieldella qijiaojingensis]|uniref:Uncharacterized protein n=1 Tax=Litchfieldella qijiaojingensis TaxID=980347 RepID=A0ABQ2Y9F7_9GAMM|nr:hypothetical protein [Halomonas qijiaojingensis]GGX77064.1 hypothetical protein GCM10007160_00280 [Halomonas qijiaojingensis]
MYEMIRNTLAHRGTGMPQAVVPRLGPVGVLAATVVAAAFILPPQVQAGDKDKEHAQHTAAVKWHAQSGNEGEVAGAGATLYTTEWGSSVHFEAAGLEPGHVYTLWWVVVNNPEACEAYPEPCTAGDVLADGNPAEAQVSYADGNVATDDGKATFSAHFTPGPIEGGWLPDQEFTNLWGAEHHFVVNDHGPLVAELMPGMMHTYRGGCSDDSPFPDSFPDTALADGEPGPNDCILTQSATLQQ